MTFSRIRGACRVHIGGSTLESRVSLRCSENRRKASQGKSLVLVPKTEQLRRGQSDPSDGHFVWAPSRILMGKLCRMIPGDVLAEHNARFFLKVLQSSALPEDDAGLDRENKRRWRSWNVGYLELFAINLKGHAGRLADPEL